MNTALQERPEPVQRVAQALAARGHPDAPVWLEVAARTGQLFSRQALELMERVAGFLLAAIAVEMMAAGLRAMFPALLGAAAARG